MFRGTFTLLVRSLRQDARLRRAHLFRIASVGVSFWLLVAAHINTAGVGAPGLKFFELVCYLCLGLIIVAGMGYFSSAITEEKEAGTLPLLLLAGVQPFSILVGKSTTRLVSSLLIFVGIFPFAILALSLGGITLHQILSGFLLLAAFLVLVANLSLLASVTRRTSSEAAHLTLGVLVIVLGSAYALPSLATVLANAHWIAAKGSLDTALKGIGGFLLRHSPVTRIQNIMETGYSGAIVSRLVLGEIALAAILFVLSGVLFRTFCEYLGEDVPGRGGALRFRRNRRRTALRRLLTPRPWKNAVMWKDFFFLTGGPIGLILRLAAVPLVAALLYWADDVLSAGVLLNFSSTLQRVLVFAALIELLVIASSIFQSEYRWHTLPTLVLLPRSTFYLCYSKVAGCALALAPVTLWLVVCALIFPLDPTLHRGDVITKFVGAIGFSLVLAHLTAFLSLVVKWGALPLAIAISMVLTSCAMPFLAATAAFVVAASGEREAVSAPIIYLAAAACSALQIAIALRFRRAAAE
jgi:hypothetical protein